MKLLLRKAEGLDPVKPWQPFTLIKEGAKFYHFGKITHNELRK